MKLHILTLSLFLFTSLISVKAQNIGYNYDSSGNCISRKTIALRSATYSSDLDDTEPLFSEDTDVKVKIYPNPTKGVLRIDIENYNDNEKGYIEVYDLSGKQLIKEAIVTSNMTVDLSNYQNGIYILILRRGENRSEWKIIKTN